MLVDRGLEGCKIGLGDLQSGLLEEFDEFLLFLQAALVVEIGCGARVLAHRVLLRGRELVPDRLCDRERHRLNQMVGQDELLRDLVQIVIARERDRILLPVDRPALHGEIDFRHRHRRRRDAKAAADCVPVAARRHPQLDAGEIGRASSHRGIAAGSPGGCRDR